MIKKFIWWLRRTFFAWSLDPTPEQIRDKVEAHVAELEAAANRSAAALQVHQANHKALVAELAVYQRSLKEWK